MLGWLASNSATSASKTLRSNAWVAGGLPLIVTATLPPDLPALAVPSLLDVPHAAVARPRPSAAASTTVLRNVVGLDISVPFCPNGARVTCATP